jgi:hypothetical protein
MGVNRYSAHTKRLAQKYGQRREHSQGQGPARFHFAKVMTSWKLEPRFMALMDA